MAVISREFISQPKGTCMDVVPLIGPDKDGASRCIGGSRVLVDTDHSKYSEPLILFAIRLDK